MSAPERIATLPNARRELPLLRRMGLMGLLILAFVAATLLLSLYNLPYYPRTWFDEGSHLHVPKTLVRYGVYADISSEGFRYYGPTIGVGPTVMLPIAAMFRLVGVGLLQARLVIVLYLLATLWLFYLLARQFRPDAPPWFALLATALLLASRGVGTLEYGREVLGEVPALAWLLFGMFAWLRALDRSDKDAKWGWLAAAGFGFGLSMVTKNQIVLIVPPLLVVLALLDWLYYKAGRWQLHVVPLGIALCCYGVWVLAQFSLLGPGDFLSNMRQTRQAAGGAIFVFSPQAMVRAVRYLLSPSLYGGLLLPALAYGLWRCRQRTRQGLREAVVCAFITLHLSWFSVSLAWPRYAFAAAALGALLVAQLCVAALAWAREATSTQPTVRLLARWLPPLVYAILALLIAVPMLQTGFNLARPDHSPQQMAAYLNVHVPMDTVVEAWEPELGVLTDHPYHYPPIELLDVTVRHAWLGGPPLNYDALAAQPQYVVVGPFASWVQIYDNATLDRDYLVEYSAGPYSLYRRK